MQKKLEFSDDFTGAILSADEIYRYILERRWDSKGKTVGFICLNPSTADASVDDQTVRKCVNFAKGWGGARLLIGNLFAYRSTDPALMKIAKNPIGEENDYWLGEIANQSDILIAAWGLHGSFAGRDKVVIKRFEGKLNALRLTKNKMPSHPLYLPGNLQPFNL